MEIKNYKNHFLIAMPSMQGEFFAKSVVYIYEHSENNGAIGFTINKPLSATLGNVMEHLTIPVDDEKVSEMTIFSGGPVGPDQGFVIHDQMKLSQNKDDKDITISTSREILQAIAKGKGPNHFIVTLGYAGWEAGQLENEIQRNDWLIAPAEKSVVFNTPISERWAVAAKLIGLDVTKLSSQTGNA